MKHKIGDVVRVRPLSWFSKCKFSTSFKGFVVNGVVFTNSMALYCGKLLTISFVCNGYYKVEEVDGYWHEWMIEDLNESKGQFIPFDINKAKNGYKVITSHGYDVRILCYDKKGYSQIVGLIDLNEDEEVRCFLNNGDPCFDDKYGYLLIKI